MSKLEDAVAEVDDDTLLEVIRSMTPELQERMKTFLKEKYPNICQRLEKAQLDHLEHVLLGKIEFAKIRTTK